MGKKDASKAKLSSDPYKGVRDFYPEDYASLAYIFSTWRKVALRMGYVEYQASILEPSELYKAKGVENEEVVKDQTYTFIDRGDREVTLRPEMTPTVARMVAAKRREFGYPLRLFSIPNCFRYERSQRGRLREFWQLNIDIFGSRSSVADSEILLVAHRMMSAFGAKNEDFVIKVGSRGFLDNLATELDLSEEHKNAFYYLLDRRSKMSVEEYEKGLTQFGIEKDPLLGREAPSEITKVIEELWAQGITNLEYAPEVVRGFNYYTGIVFEVFDTHTDNNRALMGGGRYDNLTALFDDEPLPGVGFAIGDVTMRDFLDVHGLMPAYTPPTHAYIAVTDPSLSPKAQTLAEELREKGLKIAIDFGEKKLGDQIKVASKHKIPYVIVMGEDELASGIYTVRNLESGEEKKVGRDLLAAFFLNQ